MFVCPHVSEAVVTNTRCPGIEWRAYFISDGSELDGLEDGCWFCQQCIAEHRLPPHGSDIPDPDAFLEYTGHLYRPMCPGCFKDWQERYTLSHA
jgi:hypothetical protein